MSLPAAETAGAIEALPSQGRHGDASSSERGSGTEKRAYVQRLFTRIAARYDRFNRLASCGLDQRWRRRVVQEAAIAPGMRVLDVCAGTGDLALLCARAAGPQRTVALDLNRAMLSYGRAKQVRHRVAVAWLQGDAEALPFGGGAFDRVVIGFSTRNLSDLSRGLQEMLRVVRPGGRLLILETGRPANPIVRAGYHVFLLTVARGIGWLLTGRLWPFTYLARSVRQFVTPDALVARLRGLDAEARYVPLSGGLASLYVATKAAG